MRNDRSGAVRNLPCKERKAWPFSKESFRRTKSRDFKKEKFLFRSFPMTFHVSLHHRSHYLISLRIGVVRTSREVNSEGIWLKKLLLYQLNVTWDGQTPTAWGECGFRHFGFIILSAASEAGGVRHFCQPIHIDGARTAGIWIVAGGKTCKRKSRYGFSILGNDFSNPIMKMYPAVDADYWRGHQDLIHHCSRLRPFFLLSHRGVISKPEFD